MLQIRVRISVLNSSLKNILVTVITLILTSHALADTDPKAAPTPAPASPAFSFPLALSTKVRQLAKVDEAVEVYQSQYGALEYKYDNYGIRIENLRTEFENAVNNATTAEEMSGISPPVKRDILTPDQARQLIVALNSKLHDGHSHVAKPMGGVSTLGIRVSSLNGRMKVTGFNEKYLKSADQPAKVYDEIVAIDDKPIDDYVSRNLIYVSNGTIEARKDEALERTLEVPYRLLPPPDISKKIKVTFKRGDQTFSSEYDWKTVTEIELTRPILPSETPQSGDIYAEDTGKFVFGAKGAVRSWLNEGIDNLSKSAVAAGKPPIPIVDVGAVINKARLDNIRKLKANFAQTGEPPKMTAIHESPASSLLHKIQMTAGADSTPAAADIRSRQNLEVQAMMEQLNAPVTRLKAYVVTVKEKNILVLRIPSYIPDGGFSEALNELGWIAQILHYAQDDDQISGLVIDQDTNPGGLVDYAEMLLGMFGTPEHPMLPMKARQRLSLTLLHYYMRNHPKDVTPETIAKRNAAMEAMLKQLQAGDFMTPLMPMSRDSTYGDDPNGRIDNKYDLKWTKKVVVTVDNKSASCAEIFPAGMMDNKKAMIYGQNSMGLENPSVGHVTKLNLSEMDIGFPFAEAQRLNGEHIENIGVTPDIIRPIVPEDLEDGFRRAAANLLTATYLYFNDKPIPDIQKATAKQLFTQSVDSRTFDKHKTPISQAIATVATMKKQLAELHEPLESHSADYLKIYTNGIGALKQVADSAQMPEGLWSQVSVPLPTDLLNDAILKSSWRKDVVYRRLEEMLKVPRLQDKPNTIQFIKNLRGLIKTIPDRFIFNQPCQVYLSRPDVKI